MIPDNGSPQPDMRLSRFIFDNMEAILQQWEDFARSIRPAGSMSIEALRDDAEQMLRFVAVDMDSAQTREQEIAKAEGRGPEPSASASTAARDHGAARAADRFSLIELVSEYRALRASVTRMWTEAEPVTRESVAQLIRFNEAIDQILAEGVMKFTERMDHDADLFTASVGHDLSNPVNTVTMSARLLAGGRNLTDAERAAVDRIERAADRLSAMLMDLRDFTRTRLGGVVRVEREPCDLGEVVRNVVDELVAVYGQRHLDVKCSGDLVASVDAKRLSQVVSNLVANALQHGPRDGEVSVRVFGDADTVSFEVHNTGRAIDAQRVKRLFEPLARHPGEDADDARLGLGLYIAQQIVLAHGGTVAVASTDERGTTFTVRLPRREPAVNTSA